MRQIAFYGKGGIGKSTIVSNLSASLALQGYKVLQIGCDPKADSTIGLRNGKDLPTVMEVMRSNLQDMNLEDVVCEGYGGVICVEAGGPLPGVGCAGRGIMTALEKLEKLHLYEVYQPDYVFYDVLGDVVCGGFTMPIRGGYAKDVYVVTSGENMSIYAAANIMQAIRHFSGRGYATLKGLILNQRDLQREEEKVLELAADFETSIVGKIPRSHLVTDAEEGQMSLMEYAPESEVGLAYKKLALVL